MHRRTHNRGSLIMFTELTQGHLEDFDNFYNEYVDGRRGRNVDRSGTLFAAVAAGWFSELPKGVKTIPKNNADVGGKAVLTAEIRAFKPPIELVKLTDAVDKLYKEATFIDPN